MSDGVRVLVYSAAWAGFGLTSGWLVTKMPSRWLEADRGPLRLRSFERGGRFHDRWFRVRRWKGWLPDAGSWFGGPSKSRLGSLDQPTLASFARETRRAEIVHLANVGFGPTFFLWQSWRIGLLMTVFGVVVHLPFIVVQRYNRARVERVLVRSRWQRSGVPSVDQPPHQQVALSPSRPRRRRRLIIGASLLVVTGAVVAFGVLRQERARPVTIEEATAQLAKGPRSSEQRGVPAEGVYRYEGSGTERLVLPPVEQQQGPEMPATVTHVENGCWRFRIDYSTNHWQSWDYCISGDGLIERAGASFQRLNLLAISVDVTTETSCSDATAVELSAAEGSQLDQLCTVSDGKGVTGASVGRNEFIGNTTAQVGDEQIGVLHYRRERDLTGRQRGTEEVDLWFEAETFLPVRSERRITIETDTPLGALTYEEQGDFQLLSLEPVG